MNKTDLYTRAKALYQEIVTLEQDLSALADEYTYQKDDNECGLEKSIVKATLKSAEVYVRNSVDKVEDKIVKEQEFLEFYKELSGEY